MKLIESNRHLAGTYQKTLLDQVKKQTNRLIDICGSYVVDTIEGERLFMTKREFNKWAKTNDYLTDF